MQHNSKVELAQIIKEDDLTLKLKTALLENDQYSKRITHLEQALDEQEKLINLKNDRFDNLSDSVMHEDHSVSG